MTPVIEIEGLPKEYRSLKGDRHAAVDGLDLDVPAGGVYGFLGPNGSGKTTTIRCLLGLVRPDEGECSVLGAPVPSDLTSVIRRVGSMVETPTFFGGFSGRRNLELLAQAGGISASAVEPALEAVGLASRGDDRFRTYSLGMK